MKFARLFAFTSLLGASVAVPHEKRATCPDGVHTAKNLACCSWFAVRDDLIENVFEGICGENAHSTVRIAFHDAIGFSITSNKGGGADGSIIQFAETELAYAANAGIDDIEPDLITVANNHKISFGDVIQFGSSVALSLCPGAPLVQTFVGRPNATTAAPDKTVPDPFDSVETIFERMADAGFTPTDLVSLLASHSIAAQDEIVPAIHGSPFDSTPSSFDPQIFLEVLLSGTAFPGGTSGQGEVESPLPGEFRLQSDFALARSPVTACTWQSFIGNQALMASMFGTAMAKLGLTGHTPFSLTDCTEVIPAAPPATADTAIFPGGMSSSNVQQVCESAFPVLPTAAGPVPTIPVVPEQ